MALAEKLWYRTLDVFSQERFAGSQLAVVMIPPRADLTQSQKQAIAQEFNCAVTIMFYENEVADDKPEWTISMFLKHMEIAFAGHPIVGIACMLGAARTTTTDSAPFKGALMTKAGRIEFSYMPSTRTAEVAVPHDFFIHPVRFTPDLAELHGVPSQVVESMKRTNALAPIVSIVKGMTFCLIQLQSLEDLGLVQADLKALDIPGLNEQWKGRVAALFYVRQGEGAAGEAKVRCRTIVGSFEDPAHGSASLALATYLALHDLRRLGVDGPLHIELEQGVEMKRRSVVMAEIHIDRASNKVERTILRGSAVEVMEGILVAPAV